MSDYMVRVYAEAARLGIDKRKGIYHVNVIHQDDCPMADGKGRPPCKCEPDIEFLDENRRRISE